METYDLVQKETRKKRGETRHEYKERVFRKVCDKLHAIEERTEEQEQELQRMEEWVSAYAYIRVGGVCSAVGDKGMTGITQVIYQDLVLQYGDETPVKRMLLERLVAAHAMALSYDYTFQRLKYDSSDTGNRFNSSKERISHLAEVRKGIEMANNQILKLTQAVENVNRPQVNIKATNAFVANLQQINTTPQSDVFAKDLENVQSPKNAQTVN